LAIEEPAWKRYLNKSKGSLFSEPGKGLLGPSYAYRNVPPPTTIGNREITDPDFARLVEQDERGQIAAEALGVDPSGQASGGFLNRAIRTITYVPSAFVSAAKEFLYDPIQRNAINMDIKLQEFNGTLTKEQRMLLEAEREQVSVKEFRDNLNARNFAQEMLPGLAYDSKASKKEKAAKEILGFAVDVASTGGTSGFVKLGSVLGRKGFSPTLSGAAKDAFIKNAKKLGDESEDLFEDRANMFAARVANASLGGSRSRAVAKVFEEEFKDLGVDAGKKIFKSLDKSVKGGVTIGLPGAYIGNINAGGYLVDSLARNLGLTALPKATDWAVKGYQNTKNILRADALTTPVLKNVVGTINKFLNNVGQESKEWQAVVKASLNKSSDEDFYRVYRSYIDGVDAIRDFRNLRGVSSAKANDLLQDVSRIRKSNRAAYDKAIELYKNPALLDNFVPTNQTETVALQLNKDIQQVYDEFYAELKANGFDVAYQSQYQPLLFVQGSNRGKVDLWLEKGPKNVKGADYDPTTGRRRFLKDAVDPETGLTTKVPMRASEIKEMFIREGRQDLADAIEDDPFLLLARYATSVSRLVTTKKIMSDMVKKGILLRSTTPQLNLDQASIQRIIANPSLVRQKDLDDFMTKLTSEPEYLGDYIESLNDDLAKAFQLDDVTLKKDVNERIETILSSFETLGTKLSNTRARLQTKLKKAEASGDRRSAESIQKQITEIGDASKFLREQRSNIGGTGTGVAADPGYLAQKLSEATGVVYKPLGSGLKDNFYLAPEFEKLHGTEAMVDLIERTLLLRKGDKKSIEDMLKSVDEYTQFFRTGATFGRLSGFVIRNGISAIQNNYIIAGATVLDHKVATGIAKTRILTEFGLKPFTQLTRSDMARGRLDKLAKKGKLTDDQVSRISADIDARGIVRIETVRDIQEEILEKILSKKKVTDEFTQWDVYTAGKKAGIYDRYVVLPSAQTLDTDIDDNAVQFLNVDPGRMRKIFGQDVDDIDRMVIRTDKTGKNRSLFQKPAESLLNVGFTVKADFAGRRFNIRPTQLTRDFNENVEEVVRLAPITAGLRKYGNTESGRESAGLLMKAAQFDYSNLTTFERGVMRRVLPFYTFSRNNVPAQIRALMNDPDRIRRNLAGWEAIGNVFSDEEGSSYILPDYIGQMYGFLIDDNIRKDIMEKSPPWLADILENKATNPYAFRPESPALELERWTRGGARTSLDETLNSSNPIFKALIGTAYNMNTFTKQPYSDKPVEAPIWYVKLAQGMSKVTRGEFDLGLQPDPDTGVASAPAQLIDTFTMLIPQLGTLDRTAFPIIEEVYNSKTGKDINLSKYDERAISSVISQLSGLNVTTVDPKTEQNELYARQERRKANINKVASDYQVDIKKLNGIISDLSGQGIDRNEIIRLIDDARERGELLPDYLSGTQQ